MTVDVRPDWRTIRRPDLRRPPVALAAEDATCTHGVEVLEHEPIVAVGAVVVQDGYGQRWARRARRRRRRVDLSGVEWHPQQCIAGPR